MRAWIGCLAMVGSACFGGTEAPPPAVAPQQAPPAGDAPEKAPEPPPAPKVEGVRTGISTATARRVDISVGPDGWTPTSADVKANEPVTLVFSREGEVGCSELYVPMTEARIPLPVGKTSVMVTAPLEGEMALECGKGKGGGKLVVPAEAAPAAPAAPAPPPAPPP